MENQNIKLTTEQCFGICQGFHFMERIRHGFVDIKDEFNSKIEKFSKLLIKTDLEEYTEFLLANELLHLYWKSPMNAEESAYQRNKTEIELSKILYYFLSNENREMTISIRRGQFKNDNYKADNEIISSLMFEGLLNQYRAHGYNERRLTFEAVKNKFKHFRENKELETFILDWYINNKYYDQYQDENQIVSKVQVLFYNPETNTDIPFDESKSEFEINKESEEFYIKMKIKKKVIEQSIDKAAIFDKVEKGLSYLQDDEYHDVFELLSDYQDRFIIKEDITLEWLEKRMKYLGILGKKKAGAKPKNDYLASKAEHYSYQIRLRRFINQEEYDDIEKFPISNNDCRLIFNCFVFFGYLEPEIGKSNSTKPENYIRSLIDNYRANRKEFELRSYYTKAAERGINHLKKTGEIMRI